MLTSPGTGIDPGDCAPNEALPQYDSQNLRDGTAEPEYCKRSGASKLDLYAAKLAEWLRIEAGRGRKHRRNIKQLHADLVSLGVCWRL